MCLDGTDSVSCMFVTGRNLLICAVGIRSAEFVPTVQVRGLGFGSSHRELSSSSELSGSHPSCIRSISELFLTPNNNSYIHFPRDPVPCDTILLYTNIPSQALPIYSTPYYSTYSTKTSPSCIKVLEEADLRLENEQSYFETLRRKEMK